MDCEVLIIGAGPAGLTLAIDLARRGISFKLIDKVSTPLFGSRGKGIQPRTLEVFEDLEIAEQIISRGGLYPPQRFYESGGGTHEKIFTEDSTPTPNEPYRMTLFIPQSVTEEVMRAKLLEYGYTPEFGKEIVDFTQDDSCVTAKIQTSEGIETVRALYLVGCDGGKSFVRHRLNIDFPGKSFDIRLLTADVHVPKLDFDVGHRWHDGDFTKQVGLDPLPGTNLFCLQTPLQPESKIEANPEQLTRMLRDRTGTDLTVTKVAWASAFNLSARLAARFKVGRVFIGGDAAHVHPPTGGQGLNTSVQDLYNLGWKLERALRTSDENILDTYEEERRPIAKGMLELAERILNAETNQSGAKRGREVLQLDLNYVRSSLSVSDPPERSPRAGERAPDAPFTTCAGLKSRLFNLFRGSHFTLLAYEPSNELKPAIGLQIYRIANNGEIRDTERLISKSYGLKKGELALIRPDGYIAAIVPERRVSQLDRFLIPRQARRAIRFMF